MATLSGTYGVKGVLTGRYATNTTSGVKDVIKSTSRSSLTFDDLVKKRTSQTTSKTSGNTQETNLNATGVIDWIGKQVDNITTTAKNSSEAAKTTTETAQLGTYAGIAGTGLTLVGLGIAGFILYKAIK